MTGEDPLGFVERIDGERFDQWYKEREIRRNIRQGQSYFNGPSRVPPPKRHSPSSLLKCHRKIYYRQVNAPEETEDAKGIFWTGRRFEEDIVVPFLQDAITDEATYVQNSLWIDLQVDTEMGVVRIKGETDPAIVDRAGDPVLLTEIKTKGSVDHLTGPNQHHRAQVHAYMQTLSAMERFSGEVRDAVVLYGDRNTLTVRAFHVEFDAAFWEEVLKWAAEHTAYRQADALPPATPGFNWECDFCSFKHRCGQSDEPFSDVGEVGFLPLVDEYPREQVVEYLKAHDEDEAKLTPTLAHLYPDLVEGYGVYPWQCTYCRGEFEWNAVEWDGDADSPPMCPRCLSAGEPHTVSGPPPADQG